MRPPCATASPSSLNGLHTPKHSGDFVVGPSGRLVYVFTAEGPERPPVDDLIAAVREASNS